MAPERKEIIRCFCEQCSWVKTVYNEYCFLYESGELRRELLNKISSHFFRRLQEILIEYLILNICKLTDSANCGKENNLTVEYVLKQIEPEVQEKLQLKELSKNIHLFRGRIKDARHKLVAHLDVNTTLSDKRLGEFPEGEDKQFWKYVQEFVDKIHRYHFEGEPFPLDLSPAYSAKDLLWALKKTVFFDQYFDNVYHAHLFEEKQFRYRDA